MKYNIVETFYSIQGEGKFAGTAAFFVRFYKCNLKCNFGNGFVCDDEAHTIKSLVRELTIGEIVNLVTHSGTRHVVLTGGEVSLHDVNPLIKELQSKGKYVQVETNGTNYANVAQADYITYSPKHMFDAGAPIMAFGFHELKVLAGVNNPLEAMKYSSVDNKYIQPIGNEHSWDMDNVKYCEDFVKANPAWKLSLQTHKAYGAR
jgi:organic radical activating enzyme